LPPRFKAIPRTRYSIKAACRTAVYRGRTGVRDFYARWFSAWEDLQIETERFIDAGEKVIVIDKLRGKGPGSGAEVSMRAADVLTLERGEVVRHVGYPDATEALAALGLSE
jgi:ketosteroid isomerase-like protein